MSDQEATTALPASYVQVVNLNKVIRGTQVLTNVSVEVPKGATVGLSGPNGSGKTMLMRVILGLVHPTSGVVRIDGKRLGKDMSFPPSVGFLLEGPAFLSARSGLQNLEILRSVKDVATSDDCVQAIRDVGLDPNDRRPYRKYSLGMKQRLGIAAAVFERPDLLVLDEPTNALDSSGVLMLKSLVRREQQRGATIVLACHDATILRELSDEVYFLAEGHVDGYERIQKKASS